ncbi:prolyl oligopeptidase family serine peptidase [Parvibaculum sedimenti]|uniref:Prolyl oligopeptidase family serine peptidase n=1 Tax=Parvibaculum sedimenti TaxID=2608632 RepID=A0A6N6VQZ7_9HYPH|nr:S9 family peptidase [Parvibaculum sedimenti]KAB7741656.1 prolyl oligopeptidase family serine peptidase [Parvibaculum sedimenti]
MNLTPPASAPIAAKHLASDTHHGITRTDDYAWLRDQNWRDVMRDPAALSPDIRAYLEAENDYTDAALAPLGDLRETLFAEMKGRIKEEDASVPSPDGPFAYYLRYAQGSQHPIFCRLDTEGSEQVLLDCNKEAEGEAYFRIGEVDHAPMHDLVAWTADRKGSEYFTIRVRDAATGKDLADEVPDTSGDIAWDANGKSFLYVHVDEEHRPLKVFRHIVGTHAKDDTLVYEEEDHGFYVDVGKTQSGRFLLIDIHDHQTSELRLIPAGAPATPPRLVAAREHGVEYDIEHDEDRERFLILTNVDGAEDFKLMEAPVAAPERANWRDFVPHRPGTLVLAHVAYRNHHARLERRDGLSRIVIRRLGDGAEHEIGFDEEAYDLNLSSGYEYNTTRTRFAYNSMTTPSEVYDYDMESRARTLRKRQEVPSGHNPADYVTRRIFAKAGDGELVPVSLLYRKTTKLDGSAPCLLYGYGSYGISIPASFSVTALSLVDRGFVYAIAHIRGGKEKGYRWYSDGKLLKKRNTFTDFIAAGEHLAKEGLTSRGRIVCHGGSAGGMLMGAVANMAPDLFNGIIAEVPFVDVMATMLDASLPLTPPEWHEWGNPIEDEDAYKYMASYSPYDNVRAQSYPHIFALGGLTDPRVTYWEPAKWAAKLRALRTDANLTLLRINMEAGHGGAPGRFERLKEVALVYSFALAVSDSI